MQLRRGFEVGPGDKILITEDVVTTGKSTMETVKALEDLGAEVVGLACIVDRRAEGVEVPFPLYSAVKLEIDAYDPEDCPLCKVGNLELVKPGSRDMKK